MCCYNSASKHQVFQRRTARAQGLKDQKAEIMEQEATPFATSLASITKIFITKSYKGSSDKLWAQEYLIYHIDGTNKILKRVILKGNE